ncbi:uncharacterized protein LOC121422844 [Lytechinus variegatus]|uniref:uncharacterized protein LOC121422844 n=1 Tax=Lytechinus variegatus TaxID=7654 RepID=UPI001BB25CDA|nr:uncharacterized protein LOC121422844 [Lytechinus variegatus]
MQSHHEDREDSMLLVSRMQALVRGTLIRRSLKNLRAEFEEINNELQGEVPIHALTHWPAKTPCRPVFSSSNEGIDVLQRLAKKDWRKPHPSPQSQHPVRIEGEPASHQDSGDFESVLSQQSEHPLIPEGEPACSEVCVESKEPSQQSEQSSSIEGYDTSQQYSSDFQSRSSLSSSEKSFQHSSGDSLLPSDSNVEGRNPSVHSLSERSIVDNQGANELFLPASVINETAENGEQLIMGQKRIKEEQRNQIVSKSLLPERYDTDHEVNMEGGSPFCLSHGTEFIQAQTLDGRGDGEKNEGSDDKQCNTTRSNDSEKIMQRQSLNETDLTLVSSLEESSITLSSPDKEAVSIDACHQSDQLNREDAGISSNGQRLPAGQDVLGQSSNATSGTDSSSLPPISSQSCKGPALQSRTMSNGPPSVGDLPLPHSHHQQTNLGQNEAKGSKTVTSERTLVQSQGATGFGPDDSRQVLVHNSNHTSDFDASGAADMTSIWSTDLSDSDDEVPKREDERKLREMRNNTAMELLWIQQAIESRKNYLRLKSKMTISNGTDQ